MNFIRLTKPKWWLLNILPLILFLFLLLYSFKSRQIMTWLYAHTSYYIVFALCIIWIIQCLRILYHSNFSLAKFVRSYWVGSSLALILTITVFISVPVKFKVFNDETNLLAVSQSMLYHKEAYRISMGKYYYGNFHPVEVEIPNRPLLFPFVTCMIHSILGYHYQNVFVLNFLVMFVFLSGTFVTVQRTTDTFSATAAMFLILAHPLVPIYGSSGGYDLFSTFFFCLTLLVLYDFLKSPSSEIFAFLWVSLLMFSNIRYESCIFFLIILGASLKYVKLEYFKSHAYIFSLTPILSLPFIWQRLLSVGTYENPQGVALFSVQSFLKHSIIFIENLMNLNFDLPYAGLLNIAALVIVFYLVVQVMTKKLILKPYQMVFGWILALCLSTMLVIVLAHHLGRYDLPSQARLFMYFCVFSSLTPIILKAHGPRWVTGKKLLIASIVVFLFYNPIAIKHRFINSLLATRIHHQSLTYLESLNSRNVLIISSYAGQFTAMNFGAVNFNYANRHRHEILNELKKHLYSQILIIQEIDIDTNLPKYANQNLDPIFKLNTLKEVQVLKDRWLRISAVLI